MKYFKVERNEHEHFEVKLTEQFYELVYPFYKKDSYFNIFYRLFNLLPKDFYHYVSFQYKAQFQKSKYIRHVKMSFKKEEEAKTFCKELERRFLYCVERGDFD